MEKTRLVIGTTNQNKFKEISDFFAYSAFEVVPLKEVYQGEECGEPYDTLRANAMHKAKFYGQKTGQIVLSEDAGIFLDATPEWPGVKSARIAETPDERLQLVLEKLSGVREAERGAEFRICVALYNPHEDTFLVSEAIERGSVLEKPVEASGGFGYDPIFFVPELQKAYAEMTATEKNEYSHRGKALGKLMYLLKNQFSVKHIPVPCGLVIQNGKMLMNRRNDPLNPDYHGKWEFPGGGVEFGETTEACVVREVAEEAGLEVEVVELIPQIAVEPVAKKNGVRYQAYLMPYVCRVKQVLGSSRDEEVLESRWFDLDEVKDFPLIGRNMELYLSILSQLKEIIANHKL